MNPADSLRRTLLRGGFGSIAIKLGATVLGITLSILLARILGADGYGVYAFAYAIVSVLAIPTQLGLPKLVVRETAKAQAREAWGLMRGLWRWSTWAVCLSSAVIVVVATAVLTLYGADGDRLQYTTVLVGFALIPLVALGNLRGSALMGLRKVVLGQLPESVIRPGVFVLLLATVSLANPGDGIDPPFAMTLHAIAAAGAFGLGALFLRRSTPDPLRAKPASVYVARDWMCAALPLALVGGLTVVKSQTDLLVLGVLRPSAEVGVYRVVTAGATLVAFGLQAVNLLVAPYLARFHAQDDTARLQRLATASARAALALAVPVALSFVIFGDVILGTLFGAEYKAGHAALSVLSAGYLVNAGFGLVGLLLMMTGNERDALWVTAIATTVNLALNILLIPRYGINGAAASNAVSLILWNLLLWRRARQLLGIRSTAFGI